MSDHTSAEIFGNIFKMLADFKRQGISVSDWAEYFWQQSRDYDFSAYQMDADNHLFELGYARKGEHKDYPGDIVTLYRDGRGWEP